MRNVRRRGDDRLNLGQRVVAGSNLGDDPLVGPVDRTFSKSRDEAGRDDARFARSRRADQRHEVRLVAQRAEQLRHKVFAPEEVGSVALERAEALAGCGLPRRPLPSAGMRPDRGGGSVLSRWSGEGSSPSSSSSTVRRCW
jgi:hypothetical protein